MIFLPRAASELRSDLSPETLEARLAALISDGTGAPFSGSISSAGFTITRMRAYRSSVLPVLRGRLLPAASGTRVPVALRPHSTVLVFMTVWLLFLAAVSAVIFALHRHDPTRGLLPLVAPAGLALLSWTLMIGVFTADTRWTLEHLLEVVPELQHVPGKAHPPGEEARN